MKPSSKLLIGTALLLALIGAGLWLFETYRASPPDIQYVDLVVPNGFRGGILVVSPAEGEFTPSEPRIAHVNERGLVTGSEAEPFFTSQGFAFRRVSFANGKVLRPDDSIDLHPDELGLRSTDIVDDRGMWFFVGNRNQWLQFMEGLPKPGRVLPPAP